MSACPRSREPPEGRVDAPSDSDRSDSEGRTLGPPPDSSEAERLLSTQWGRTSLAPIGHSGHRDRGGAVGD